MITLDLVEYIKSQLNKNVSKDLIISQLSNVGWHIEDIEEGFSCIEKSSNENILLPNNLSKNTADDFSQIEKVEEKKEEPVLEVKKTFDQYREMPEGDEPLYEKNIEKSQPSSSLELLKIWVPTTVKPKEVVLPTEIAQPQEVKPIKVFEMPDAVLPQEIKPIKVFEMPDVVLPQEVKPEINQNNVDKINELKSSNGPLSTDIEPYKIELEKEDLYPVINKTPVIAIPEIKIIPKSEMFVPEDSVSSVTTINKNPIVSVPEIKIIPGTEKIFVPEESFPIITETNKNEDYKPIVNTNAPVQKTQPIQSSIPVKPTISSPEYPDSSLKGAMISSYSQAVLSSTKANEIVAPKKKNIFLKLLIAIIIISIISGMIFAFVEGYLKFPGSNFSLSVVKKDPKVVMLKTPSDFSIYKSYKSETNITVTSPSLSNITIGLSSGEVVTSKEKDSIAVNIIGSGNTNEGKINTDFLFTFKSSLLKSDIVSDWKYDGSKLYVSIPDLNQIFDKDAPSQAVVSMDPNQLGLIANELSTPIQNIIKKIDIYNILSNDIPLYVKNESESIFKEFIGNLEYRELESEFIKGVDTYHYGITASRPVTKKMLSQIAELLIAQLPSDQKNNMDEAIGASDINSFEIWVGKNDQNLYQFKFTLNVPLSKVLGLNDSGIAGNEVKLDWMTTFYDIDIENNITMPTDSINVKDFVKNIKDKKIKNIISIFKPEATLMKNAIGSYGLRSNPMGSCTNPNPGSLFSPQGHAKGADTAISAISKSMISLLTATNGAGSCYSTSGAWALSAPLFASSSDASISKTQETEGVSSFYCTDSSGIITILDKAIIGPNCK